MKKDTRAYACTRKKSHCKCEISERGHTRKPHSHSACVTSLAAAVSSAEFARGAAAKKCSKANLHLALVHCVPHPMPSFHSPNDGSVELSKNWLKSSNTFCFHNQNMRNGFLPLQGGYVLIQTQLKNQAHHSIKEIKNRFPVFFCLSSGIAFSLTPRNSRSTPGTLKQEADLRGLFPTDKHNLQS